MKMVVWFAAKDGQPPMTMKRLLPIPVRRVNH
jgi:hypothetical protein